MPDHNPAARLFPLRDIRTILDSPGYDRGKVLARQAELLELKKKRLEKLIALARGIEAGGIRMDFKAFDTKKIDEYAAQAKKAWGTPMPTANISKRPAADQRQKSRLTERG